MCYFITPFLPKSHELNLSCCLCFLSKFGMKHLPVLSKIQPLWKYTDEILNTYSCKSLTSWFFFLSLVLPSWGLCCFCKASVFFTLSGENCAIVFVYLVIRKESLVPKQYSTDVVMATVYKSTFHHRVDFKQEVLLQPYYGFGLWENI